MISNERRALKLLRNAAEHLQQVLKMVEERKYCLDVIQESRVVQRYMKMADKEMLSGHLKECVKKVLGDSNFLNWYYTL